MQAAVFCYLTHKVTWLPNWQKTVLTYCIRRMRSMETRNGNTLAAALVACCWSVLFVLNTCVR